MIEGFYTQLINPFANEYGMPDENGLELNTSPSFFEAGIKLSYDLKITAHSVAQFNGGIKNIFNSFQDDFDSGIDRDPAYIYGSLSPRTVYFGVKIGNF